MALRKSPVLMGFFALGLSCWVAALGLGELTLHSKLDEPFNAEIELINVGDTDENQVFVALASKEDFERAGVSWEFHLLDLNFNADLSDAKHPVIKVSSKEPIKEPYLDFVAQLEWPSGRLLREYTLFLDLPVFNSNKTALATKTTVSSPSSEKASSTLQQTSIPRGASSQPLSQYRVKGGDTLWKVASQTKFEATTVHQQMAAIHAENPGAFVNGNTNLLKKGAVLRIPKLSSVKLISQQQAKQLITEQSRLWNQEQQKARARELIDDAPATTTAATQEQGASADGLLRLSTPTETSSTQDRAVGRTTGGEGSASTPEALKNDLGITQEELDRTKRENLELKAKLANLEAQLNTTTQLLEIESDDLKAIQLGVATQSEADHPGDEMDHSPSPVDAGAATTVIDPVITSQDESTLITSDKTTPLEKRAQEDSAKDSLHEFLTFFQTNLIPLLGLVGVLLGVLLLIRKSKKDDQPEPLEPFLSPDTNTIKDDVKPFTANDDTEQDILLEVEPTTIEPEVITTPPVELPEEVDPCAEADIYLSLGNFSEAHKVIETAIEAKPNDTKLHLKKLDLFSVQQDAKGFDAHYPTLVALGDAEATATADRLRGNIDEEPLEIPPEATHQPTLEDKVAEELGIEGLELNLFDDAEPQAQTEEGFVAELDEPALETDSNPVASDDSAEDVDELAFGLNESATDIDPSDVELDLSEIELDLKTAAPPPPTTSEAPEEGFEETLFGDISLPDEVDDLSNEIGLPELADEETESPDQLIADSAGQDTQFDNEDDLELSLDSFDFDNDDLDLEIGADESKTQLELAQAYIEMGDKSGAKDILAEVLHKGSDEQKQQANELLAKLS